MTAHAGELIESEARRPNPRCSTRRGVIAMVLATMSWGLSTVVNKLTLDQTAMRPMSQQSMQLTASVAVLIVVVTIRGKRPSTSAWRLGRSGLLEPGASYVLGLIGLAMTAASHASIIGALEPTFVAVGAWMFLHQRLSGRAAALMSITLIGALLVVTSSLGIGSTATVDGDVLLVVSVVCAATYVLLCSRSVGVVEPIIATLTQQVWALAIVLPALAVSVVTGGFGPLPHGSGWGLVVISGLLSYVIPFALYLTALESLPASSTAQYLALIPLFGMLGAATILGEPITARSLVGGVVVIVALVLLARLSGREPPGPVASPPITRCRRP